MYQMYKGRFAGKDVMSSQRLHGKSYVMTTFNKGTFEKWVGD